MRFVRSSGILFHPTSLPGAYGIGDLGDEAHEFLRLLVESGQTFWQVMPLGPTGYGDSPYQAFSAFAGNPLLVSPDKLVADGYLDAAPPMPHFPAERVDYGPVIEYKFELLRGAFGFFQRQATPAQRDAFHQFCQANAFWLDDYALFMALKRHHGGGVWSQWKPEIATRQPAAVQRWSERLREEIEREKYQQFLFDQQWSQLRRAANAQGVRIIGDAPIFVAYDSADVWAHPEMFRLDATGRPTHVAGVPPDYFSPTGQLWGNPLYRWDWMADHGFGWWIERLRKIFEVVDVVRLDHFRGFEAYWEVPAGEETAINGHWVQGPGMALFAAARQALGELPIIAEDLGVITPEVEALRDECGFPGMKVLQFAFGSGAENPYLPHNYTQNCVVYTGTHDNDTTIGWFATREAEERKAIQEYLARDGHDIAWDLMRLAHSSVAELAVVPLQDVLRLGSAARMNTPGRADGNWGWRLQKGMFTDELVQHLHDMTRIYGRLPKEKEPSDEAPAS